MRRLVLVSLFLAAAPAFAQSVNSVGQAIVVGPSLEPTNALSQCVRQHGRDLGPHYDEMDLTFLVNRVCNKAVAAYYLECRRSAGPDVCGAKVAEVSRAAAIAAGGILGR